MKYVHAPLGEDVEFLAGSYCIDQEDCIPVDGREVLYLLGQTSSVITCCGDVDAFSFVKVIGFVQKWQNGRDEKGSPVSEIETIKGEPTQFKVREFIHKRHPNIDLLHIEFR